MPKYLIISFYNMLVLSFHDSVYLLIFNLQEFAGEDDSDLFLEEREAALRQAEEEKRRTQRSVPGIINPHDVEDMQD